WDVRIPFVVYGAMALLSTLPGTWLMRNMPLTQRGHAAVSGPDIGWGWLKAVPLIIFFVGLFFAGVSRGALFNGTLNVYAVYTYDVGAGTVGFMAAAAAAVGIPVTL